MKLNYQNSRKTLVISSSETIHRSLIVPFFRFWKKKGVKWASSYRHNSVKLRVFNTLLISTMLEHSIRSIWSIGLVMYWPKRAWSWTTWLLAKTQIQSRKLESELKNQLKSESTYEGVDSGVWNVKNHLKLFLSNVI